MDTLRRIEEFAGLRTDANVEVRHSDSRRASFPPIHGVITSPPYVGLIDYHDQHAYAYHQKVLVSDPFIEEEHRAKRPLYAALVPDEIFKQSYQTVRFARAELGQNSSAIGAATFALQEIKRTGKLTGK